MSDDNKDIQNIKKLQSDFRSKFSVLKKAKADFLKLFRKKLEDKKLDEIKSNLAKVEEK